MEAGLKLPNPVQQYNLKWTNHTNNMLQIFQQHLVKESFVDVTLSCEGCFIKAHKLVLSACSVYFEQLFEYHTVPHPLIIMNGIKFNDLKQVIEFMYRGEIKVCEADLDSLLTLAETMQVKGLSNVRNKHLPAKTESKIAENASENIRKRRRSSASLAQSKNDENTPSSENRDDAVIKSDDSEEGSEKFKNIKESQFANVPMPIRSDTKRLKFREVKLLDDNASKIPRPPNAFMIFANEWRKKIAEEYPMESNKDISIRLGNMWKLLQQNVKDTYYAAAKKADEEHKVKYPGYYYSPKEARERKALGNSGRKPGIKFVDASNLVKLVMPSSDNSENDDSPRNSIDDDKIDLSAPNETLSNSEEDRTDS